MKNIKTILAIVVILLSVVGSSFAAYFTAKDEFASNKEFQQHAMMSEKRFLRQDKMDLRRDISSIEKEYKNEDDSWKDHTPDWIKEEYEELNEEYQDIKQDIKEMGDRG